tara:strand:+ start:12370 stop:13470 length:1101 start_codon:yes stop_codon:yes gene_type:complete
MLGKRVTLLISSLAGGGAEGVCVSVANGLVDQGWQVSLVMLHTEDSTYLGSLNSNVKVTILGVNHARNAPIHLLKYIWKNKPRKILVFNYELTVILIILRSLFKFKTKIIARNINTFSKNTKRAVGLWKRVVVKPLINYFYCKADHIINQCHAMRDDLLNVYPQLASRTSVIYNPVSKRIEEYAKEFNLEKRGKQDYLLCVGRLEEQKAFHYAIEAFAEIESMFPTLRLKIVGQGSLESELKQLAKKLRVADRVDFEGFQADIIFYYINAKMTLLTSLYEGFPNVLLESISLGTPVVSFDCPSGPREIIVEGKNGFLVRDKSVAHLSGKIGYILQNKFSSSIVSSTSTQFKTEQVIAKYADKIESI